MPDDHGSAESRSGGDSPRTPESRIGPPWLLQAKVSAPSPPGRYLRRASLQSIVDSVLDRPLTVLEAPAGFGKTAVLADLVRGQKRRGVAVAWLSLDEFDTPEVFGIYLARAVQQAGIDVSMLREDDFQSPSPFPRQLGKLARVIEAHAAPCLLVLDEVERLPARTVRLLEELLRRSPGNLHLVLACRFNPGLDLASPVLDGLATIVEVEAFRFSRLDIANLWDGALSQRKVAKVEGRTAGWPIAVVLDRRLGLGPPEAAGGGAPDVSRNFVGVRLLRGVSPDDRRFLLDLSVFDRVSADIVDEVLGSGDTRRRISSLPWLRGLLLSSDEHPGAVVLHPLVKDCCGDRLTSEDPARKRELHARIAGVLAQRRQLLPALRHASSSGDGRLIGELVERTGAFGLWLREGGAGVAAASRALPPEIMRRSPRLALVRSVHLQWSSKPSAAVTVYEAVRHQTDGFTRDRDGGDAEALMVDRTFAETVLAGGRCRSRESALDTLGLVGATPESGSDRGRLIAGARSLLLCVYFYERGGFDESRQHGEEARALFGSGMPYGEIFAGIHLGMVAMAQGYPKEASSWYGRARRSVRSLSPPSPRLTMAVDALSLELDLERDRPKTIRQRTLRGFAELRSVWHEVYAAGIGAQADLVYRNHEVGAATRYLTRTMSAVREIGTPSLVTHVSAVLAFYLAKERRTDEAGKVWKDQGLPCEAPALLDLEGRSWRAMEALSVGRVALLSARGERAAALELADALWPTALRSGNVRTALRGLGLSMAIAFKDGDGEHALSRLAKLLSLTHHSDYYRSLADEREISRTLLKRLLATGGDEDLLAAAEAALARLDQPSSEGPELSARELEVLAEVREGLPNRKIASLLGITEEGVRYHLSNIYRKIGVSGRAYAVRYAEARGLLP